MAFLGPDLLHIIASLPLVDLKNIVVIFGLFFSFFLFISKTTSLPPRRFSSELSVLRAWKEGFTQIYFILIFFEHSWVTTRGFQPNRGTQVPHGGFHMSPFIFVFVFVFSLFFCFFLLQGLGGLEAETLYTTITVLMMLLMNSRMMELLGLPTLLH